MTLAPEVLAPRPPRWRYAVALAIVASATAASILTHARDARLDVARAQLRDAAARVPAATCPRDLPATLDPWGHPLRFVCTKDPGAEYFASDGPDGVPGTPDDLRSR